MLLRHATTCLEWLEVRSYVARDTGGQGGTCTTRPKSHLYMEDLKRGEQGLEQSRSTVEMYNEQQIARTQAPAGKPEIKHRSNCSVNTEGRFTDSTSVLVLAVHCLTPFYAAECFRLPYEQEERVWTVEMNLRSAYSAARVASGSGQFPCAPGSWRGEESKCPPLRVQGVRAPVEDTRAPSVSVTPPRPRAFPLCSCAFLVSVHRPAGLKPPTPLLHARGLDPGTT
jgi:hypothetical protein